MKRVMSVLAVPALLLATAPLQAQEEGGLASWLSGNVSLTTDYTFRGISQTLQQPALQGGMDLRHPSGFYVGTWGSSVNFGETNLSEAGPRAQVEVDVYGGYGLNLLPVATIDIGALYYMYPGAGGARNYDFVEFGLGASRTMGPFSGGLSAKYSPDFYAGAGEAFYYGASAGIPVSVLTISGNIGKQMIEDNSTFGTPDYLDWGVGASVGWKGFTIGGRVVGTDVEESECFSGSEYCGTRVMGSISRAM
jgi:uncharacterized protein (TIGR02001 family)